MDEPNSLACVNELAMLQVYSIFCTFKNESGTLAVTRR